MGQIVSGPITSKASGDGCRKDLGLAWSFTGMQGWRDRMEDAHLALPSLGEATGGASSQRSLWWDTAVFGVMDGHGGEHVAHFCERYLPMAIAQGPADDVPLALVGAFQRMDELLFDPTYVDELQSMGNDFSPVFNARKANPDCVGCTAVVCCIRPGSITVANAGDSRAVLCRKGIAIDMSEDHKPNLPEERRRIQNAGGCVMEQRVAGVSHYRVNGNLNLSRSIGDLSYKQNFHLPPQDQMICCTPDVRTFWRQPGDEFIVLACDGVWDVLSSQEVCDYIRPRLGDIASVEERMKTGALRLTAIIEGLLDDCISPDLTQTYGLGGDNMTVVLVVFTGRGSIATSANGRCLDSPSATLNNPAWLCPYK